MKMSLFAAALVAVGALATPVLADAESSNDDSTGAESFDWIAFGLRHQIHSENAVVTGQSGDRFLVLLDRDETESLSDQQES